MKFPAFINDLLGGKRARVIGERILPYLKNSKTIIDVGCGTGHVTAFLLEKNKDVVAVDIRNQSLAPNTKVVIYDGKRLPYKDKTFDTSLLITVLHHTPSPLVVFSEAARVSKGDMVIIETTYKSFIGKIFIVLFDSLVGRQMKPYWGSYKTDAEWQHFFKQNGFKVVSTQYHADKTFGIFYNHYVYHLKKDTSILARK
ncbi:methyltransferase domain-containing protein [Candidatus Gottesmanbacteria bacterium]|nr:methyltransferase domain-containing protein [Candidatus Gottesmanbacteria bacterium]